MTDESLFEMMVELSDSERRSILSSRCEDEAQKQRVLALLAAHDAPDSFLKGKDTTDLHDPGTRLHESSIGNYKLLQQLGEGGMGTVFMAEQQRPVKRRVAVKIIKAGMDSRQFIARFEAERQALAMMDHPNIAQVHDGGTTEQGRPYFVMELVKGIPITKFCDENKLSMRERIELFMPICQAVQHAHQKGIIHRDLKPSNVLIAMYDDQPVPKVIDFGVAKATNQQLTDKTLFTLVGQIVGTWEYMSPEQAVLNQLDVDTRSDVYSLGVILYELLTGVTPIDGERLRSAALEETLRLIREEEPPKPSTRVSSLGTASNATATYRSTTSKSLSDGLRGDLDWIVMKTLEKDRKRRYESASDLGSDLQRYLASEPIEARPPSSFYRLSKFARRNTGLMYAVGATALSVALIIAALSVGLWKAGEVERELLELLANYKTELQDKVELAALRADYPETTRIVGELGEVNNRLGIANASDASLPFYQGLAHFYGGDIPTAQEHLNAAIEIDPGAVGAQSILAVCDWYTSGEQYERLMQELHDQVGKKRISPNDELWFSYAELYRDPVDAFEHVKSAVQHRKSTIGSITYAGIAAHLAYHSGDREHLDESLRQLAIAENNLPNNPFIQMAGLWVRKVAVMGFGESDGSLRQAGDRLAREMGEARTFSSSHFVRGEYYWGVGEKHLALEHHKIGAEISSLNVGIAAPLTFSINGFEAFQKYLDSRRDDSDTDVYRWSRAVGSLNDSEQRASAMTLAGELCKSTTKRYALRGCELFLLLGEIEDAREAAARWLDANPNRIDFPYGFYRNRLQFIAGLVDEDELKNVGAAIARRQIESPL